MCLSAASHSALTVTNRMGPQRETRQHGRQAKQVWSPGFEVEQLSFRLGAPKQKSSSYVATRSVMIYWRPNQLTVATLFQTRKKRHNPEYKLSSTYKYQVNLKFPLFCCCMTHFTNKTKINQMFAATDAPNKTTSASVCPTCRICPSGRLQPLPPPPPPQIKMQKCRQPHDIPLHNLPPHPLTPSPPQKPLKHHSEPWQQVGDIWQAALISWLGKRLGWQWGTCVCFGTCHNLSDPLIWDAFAGKPPPQ